MTPELDRTVIDPERQKLAKNYARIQRRLLLFEITFGILYLSFWLITGKMHAISSWFQGYSLHPSVVVAGGGLVLAGFYYLLSFPLAFFEGYYYPKKFDQSTQSFWAWIVDQIKMILIGGGIGLLLLEVMYSLLGVAAETWWIWVGIFLLIFNIFLSFIAPTFLFPIFFKFKPLSDEYSDLANRLIHLAYRTGTTVVQVYEFDLSSKTRAVNAALTGLGQSRRIILGDTLLKDFSNDEIETVMGHELGHLVHKDILYGILYGSLINFVGLYLTSRILFFSRQTFSIPQLADISSLPLILLSLGFFGFITMPLGNALSRNREYKADQFTLQLTRNPEAFASALTKLTNQNLAELEPEPWVEFLLYSHPSLKKRITQAQLFH